MSKTISETITENAFRNFYGPTTFIEKDNIDKKYGFKSKKNINNLGKPDFFLEYEKNLYIIVEAKGSNLDEAITDIKFYMSNNNIKENIIGIAIASKTENKQELKYFYKKDANSEIKEFGSDTFLPLTKIKQLYNKEIYGEEISDTELISILNSINSRFHKNNIKDTERSLFFSGIMIALTDDNFRKCYNLYEANNEPGHFEAEKLNEEIIGSISKQLKDKINNHSKSFKWEDRFSFIKTIDIKISDYKEIINEINEKIYIPFSKEEKYDLLGKAYKIFLTKSGKADNKNIILTPDHIKSLMVKLANLSKSDVVLDTCTGSGGFLMSSMEEMIQQCDNDYNQIEKIKEERLIGFEIDSVLFSLACTNMYLHGDGKTNMIYHSSLLNINNEEDKNIFDNIKQLKPTVCIINPPYENNQPILFVEQALNFLEKNGKLIIIMPRNTLEKNNHKTKELLKTAKLNFVINCPKTIFKEQDRDVYTSIFGFTKTEKPQKEQDTVLFYELEDDGLVSIQHKGRVDKFNIWPKKEQEILNFIENKDIIPGVSEKRSIIKNDNIVFHGNIDIISELPLVKFGEIFNTDVKGTLASEDCDNNGNYNFITAAEAWKKHSSYDYNGEAIIYAVGAEGSLGRAHYAKGKFIASNLCLVLTPKNNDKYKIDLEFYSYYLMSIREQIVKRLRTGTSKLTIPVDALYDYLIEYVDYDKQIELKAEIKDRLKKFNQLKNDFEKAKENLYNGLNKIM